SPLDHREPRSHQGDAPAFQRRLHRSARGRATTTTQSHTPRAPRSETKHEPRITRICADFYLCSSAKSAANFVYLPSFDTFPSLFRVGDKECLSPSTPERARLSGSDRKTPASVVCSLSG